ncbi:MAG: hypothetical protein IJS14_05775 [Lentisphaeria bacterium]|nr:hypothetical protein [Lentisphaeria bacterium]
MTGPFFSDVYGLMKPDRFQQLRATALEMLTPDDNSRKWRSQPIRNWAGIYAGIDNLMPNSDLIERDSLLHAFTLVCVREYERSRKIAMSYLDKPEAAYSANLILGLQTVHFPENVRYLKAAFAISPLKTFAVLDWFSSNTDEIGDQPRYQTFLRTWITCAAGSVKELGKRPRPEVFTTVSRIELLSMQDQEEIRPFYQKLKSMIRPGVNIQTGKGTTYYYRNGIRFEGPPPQPHVSPQITLSQLQQMKARILKNKADIEKRIQEGTARPETLQRIEMQLKWIENKEREMSGKTGSDPTE